MGEPFFVQTDVGLLHLGSDPGSVLSRARGRGAGPDYGLEGLIKRDLESPLVEDLAQAVRAVKLRRLEDKPRVRRPPENRLSIAVPREDPQLVGQQQPRAAQVPADRQQSIRLGLLGRRKNNLIDQT